MLYIGEWQYILSACANIVYCLLVNIRLGNDETEPGLCKDAVIRFANNVCDMLRVGECRKKE